MQTVLERAVAGSDEAELAVGVYVPPARRGHRGDNRRGGIDALIFSRRGGRARHREVTGEESVRVFVLAAREDFEIARAVRVALPEL
jgi:hypothetical protein